MPASATTWKRVAPIEQRDQALADDLVVVDDEQAERTRLRLLGMSCSSSCRGMPSAVRRRLGRAARLVLVRGPTRAPGR